MKKCLEVSLFALVVLAGAMGLKAMTLSPVSIDNTVAAQNGRPVPRLAQNGRPVPRLAQNGRPVPRVAQNGRPVPR